MNTVISVIVPHLNQPEFLGRSLDALHAQTFDAGTMEIIVVDNGSHEMPQDVVDAFPGVTLVRETTPGPGPARNLGVSLANGDILAFIDADCIADENWLRAIHDCFAADPALEIIGGEVKIWMTDPARPTLLESYENIYAFRQEEYIRRQGFSGAGNLAMRPAIFANVGPFAGIELAEDTDWGQRATRLGYCTHFVAEMLVYHPARRSMAELCTKWDRNISHHYRDRAKTVGGKLKWLAAALAMSVSPITEIPRVLRSRRVSSPRERFLAFAGLVGIRFYRTRKMLTVMVSKSTGNASALWNRE